MARTLARALTPLLWATLALAADAPSPFHGTAEGRAPEGPMLVGGDNRIVILDPSGAITWEYKPTGLVHDVWRLPNGNVLFADGGSVTEVSPDKQVVWRFRSASGKGDATYGCQRLPDGKTLVAENATGRILEVDAKGQVTFSLQCEPHQDGAHGNLRLARKLDNGHYLVCLKDARLVREYTPEGQIVMEIKLPDIAFSAVRTPDGTTLVGCLSHVLAFDAQGKLTWGFDKDEAQPDVRVGNITGVQLLPSGHLLLGIYAADTADGHGCNFLEVDRDKHIVWRFCDPHFAHSSMAVEMLDADGKALSGPVLR
jgi:hypothetical protein